MKKITALILTLLLLFTFASCSQPADNDQTVTENSDPAPQSGYILSDEVAEESIIDGVMTDISGSDEILKKSVAAWADTCVMYEVNIRQFTEEGTFAAFEGHLDRLKDMGVNTLWLMPIHPISETERKGTLGSYYAVSDYKAVNPEFGTMDDFKHLLEKAHGMGFKVLLDWVANHTGWDCAWINEHPDWYVRNKSGEIESPYDWTDTAQLDYENYEMRAEMIRCMQFWVEDIGVDGFRCDHALGVPAPFWNAAVYKLKSVNSEILMLAEASANRSMTKYAFDCCYNDQLYGQATMVQGGIGTSSVKEGMALSDSYAEGSFPMNYLDNHDKNSYEGSIVERFGDTYPTLLTLTFLTPGIPMLYTSDEQGYDHEIEFFEKDTVKWDGAPKYADQIRTLAQLKQTNPALATSNTAITFCESGNENAFAFTRENGSDKVIFVSNLLYNELKGADVEPDFDSAVCVMHYDGASLDLTEKEMSADDFKNRDYRPYEYFVLVAK